MTRPLLSLFLLLLTLHPASGQVKGLLGLPDRIMSSSRIGRVSSRDVLQIPMPDSSKVIFPSSGTDFISEDYDFFKYLLDNGYSLDARTLSKHPYFPSDTLDFLRAKVLFSDRKLSQAADLFSKVPVSSVFGPESLFYGVVSLSTLGEYDRASWMMESVSEEPVFSEGGPYSELALLQNAGLALLRGNKDDWLRLSGGFTYSDYTLEEQRNDGRSTGKREKHTGEGHAWNPAADEHGRIHSDQQDLFGGGDEGLADRLDPYEAIQGASLQCITSGNRWWRSRTGHKARGSNPGPERDTFPRRIRPDAQISTGGPSGAYGG